MNVKSVWRIPRQVRWILFAMGVVVGGWLGWRVYLQRVAERQTAAPSTSREAGDTEVVLSARVVEEPRGPQAADGQRNAGGPVTEIAAERADASGESGGPPGRQTATAGNPGEAESVPTQPTAVTGETAAAAEGDAHPLDPALKMAREGLARIREEVRDYTATLTKRERIRGRIVEQKMNIKVRQPREEDGRKIPMSVYLKFLAPASAAGREVIWIKGQNEGKLIAHEGGLKNLLRVHLPPDSMLAMLGNRYPITEIGIENLIVKLIERGERDKLLGDCQVRFLDERLGDRECQVIEVTHPDKEPQFDFYQARIFIDKELQVPVRYTAYVWAEDPAADPLLDEEYIYEDMQLNVGLTDKDFDPDNDAYAFP